MAELNPPLGTTTPEIFMDNVKRADELVNGPAGTVNDRGGKPLDTWRLMMAKNDEIRQNIIPLSKQYATLAAAQADIANIPVGSTTYYRSPDDSALAIEVMNVGGTLTATGREMPSQQTVINVNTALRELIDELPNDVLFLFSDSDGFRIADIALDQTGKPVLSLGRLSLSRNSGSVFDITDADGFTVSVDDLTNRVFQIEQGKFVYAGQELQRSPENLFEITDVDGFSFAVDNLIERVANLEKNNRIVNSDLVARLESLAQSLRSSLSFPVSAPVALLKTGVNIYIFFGQSLAIGDEAFTTVTRQPSQLGNVMLGLCVRGQYYDRTSDSTFGVVGGENKYYPLQEKRQNGADIITDPAVSTRLGETVASGFAETLKTLHNRSLGVINDEQTIIACSVTGAVGTSLSTLLKGATSTPYYQRLISCVQGHMEAAAAAGHTDVRVAGLVFLQGENDYGGTARESYLQMLNQLIDDFNADVKAITGQTDNPGFYLYQTGGTYVSQAKGNTLPVDMAQLDITSRPDAFMVAPMFPYPQAVAAKTHKSANAYRWWGCAAANAVHHIYKEMNHSPFRMVKAVYDGTRIYVPFMVPCPPLAIQPFYVVSTPTVKSDWGFTVIDSAGTLSGAALSVEIVSPSVVCITPSRPLSGGIRINLGDQLHGGGHNIADSSPQQAIFNWQYYGDDNQSAYENISSLNDAPYSLCNFAAIQTINVETNS
ncbi:TPA: sialate O-acetylesterase [Klebsiella pneumoniae]|nr:sialate O-acetylesterase [Klebsiella pneumoniae]